MAYSIEVVRQQVDKVAQWSFKRAINHQAFMIEQGYTPVISAYGATLDDAKALFVADFKPDLQNNSDIGQIIHWALPNEEPGIVMRGLAYWVQLEEATAGGGGEAASVPESE